jgi:hypothetical protein
MHSDAYIIKQENKARSQAVISQKEKYTEIKPYALSQNEKYTEIKPYTS